MLSKESEPKSSGLRSSAGLAGSAVGVFKLEISILSFGLRCSVQVELLLWW